MSLSPNFNQNSPEPAMADVCINLDNEFLNEQDSSKAEGMNVYARVRPMLDSEVEAGYKECIAAIDDNTVRAVFPSSSSKYKTSSHHKQEVMEDFVFTSAFGPETGQFVFFEECMMNTMQNFIEGQNSLVFSYGSTGSGKTFTLQGNTENPGIIPLSLHLFFASIEDQLLPDAIIKPEKFTDVIILNDNDKRREAELKEQLISSYDQEQEWASSKKSLGMILCKMFSDKYEVEERKTTLEPEEMAQAQAATLMKEISQKTASQQSGYCNVWVSFVEIYNENVYDLLQPNINPRPKLNLGEDKNGDVYVKGLREVCVNNSLEALKLLSFGKKNLKIASTKLNYQSSRSHCIFTIKVIRVPDPENITYAKVNRLSFCDLAGSERAAKSQTTGMRLKEAGCINTSLLVLGRCMEQLRLNSTLKDKKMIPFRESKLTRLFSGFFTGKGKAVMIANASPSELTFDETLHVLKFSALSKELIINDSYIATASNTLQTITNMWANARANANVSTSDKSISFEDSMEDFIQEKDELIEKLLDLADSLRNNLEREKKEKAELEMKIRQDVYQEYSEYSDQLLERQKQRLESEQCAIKEIYNKRIAKMEKMYEKIINGYKRQLNESYSSGDEAIDEISDEFKMENAVSDNQELQQGDSSEFTSEIKAEEIELEKTSEEYIFEIESLKNELLKVREDFEKTKDELQKVINYATSLETASVEMEKDNKISNQNLAKALADKEQLQKQNESLQASYQEEIINLEKQLESYTAIKDESEMHILQEKLQASQQELADALESKDTLQKEFEAFKIDFVFYKTDYDNVLTKKLEYEERVKCLSSELDGAKSENAKLEECLHNTENIMSSLKQSISVMENEIAEYKKKLQTQEKLEEALMQQKKETEITKEALKDVDKALENAFEISKRYETRILELESECHALQNSKDILSKEKEHISVKLLSSIEELKIENQSLKTKFEKTLESESSLKEAFSVSETRITELTNDLEKQKELVTLMKENEKDYQEIKELLEARSKALKNADLISEKQKEKIETLESECLFLKNNLADMSKNKDDLDDGYTSLLLELENCKQENSTLKKELEKAEKSLSSSKKLIADLEVQVTQLLKDLEKQKELEEAKNQMEKDAENAHKLLDDCNANLKTITTFAEEQKKKIELVEAENSALRNEIVNLQKIQEELQKKVTSLSKELESVRNDFEIKESKLVNVLQENNDQKEEINSLKAECTIHKKEISVLNETNNGLQEKLSALSNDLEPEKNDFEAKEAELMRVLQENNGQKEVIISLKAECAIHKKEILVLNETNSSLQDKLSVISNDLESMKNGFELKEAELVKVLQENNDQKEEISSLKAEYTTQKEEIIVLNETNSNLQEKLSVISNDLEEAKKCITDLKENVAQSEVKINLECLKADFEEEIKNLKQKIELLNVDLKDSLKITEDQKRKIDDLENENATLKNKISELEEAEGKLTAEITVSSEKLVAAELSHKEEIDSLIKKYEDIFKVNESLQTEISQLQQLRNDMEEKLSTQRSLTDNAMLELIQIVEKCEIQASNKIKSWLSDSTKYINCVKDIEGLIEKSKKGELDCEVLHEMVQILQRCEVKATNKAKQLHSSSIKHVEQIMDLEKSIKKKMCSIESLQNDNNTLQKQFKDFQTTSRKQLQNEKREYEIEIESIKKLKAAIEKENVDLKLKLDQLQNEKREYEIEIESIKKLKAAIEKENVDLKLKLDQLQQENEKLTTEAEKSRIISQKTEDKSKNGQLIKKQPVVIIESLEAHEDTEVTASNLSKKSKDEKKNISSQKQQSKKKQSEEKSESKNEIINTEDIEEKKGKKLKEESEKSNTKQETQEQQSKKRQSKEKRDTKKNETISMVENKKEKGGKQLKEDLKENNLAQEAEEQQPKKRQSKEKSKRNETISTKENKKEKEGEKLKEDLKENVTKQETEETKRAPRRHLRNLKNVTLNLDVMLSKSSKDATKNKSLKRKRTTDDILDEKLPAQKTMKLQSINNSENKPQNLRVALLKGNTVNDTVPHLSPRLTRGRKRLINSELFQNKENDTGNKSRRGVRW